MIDEFQLSIYDLIESKSSILSHGSRISQNAEKISGGPLMNVYVGADHKGYELKNIIREHLHHKQFEVEDKGAIIYEKDDDYPQFAYAVAAAVLGEDNSLGILVCGSGQGMAIAANKVRGIRAALAWSPAEARAARHDDDANILVLPADMIDTDTALAIVDDFVGQKFSGEGRHQRRLDQIEELYG